jgi:ribonuclease HI
MLDLADRHVVTFHWVRGHAGDKENERADRLAVAAASQPDLPPDEYYEAHQANGTGPRAPRTASTAQQRRFYPRRGRRPS